MERRTMYRVSNPHLDALSKDILYHLGLSTEDDLQRLFGDVKFVCLGGSVSRMEGLSVFLHEKLEIPLPEDGKPTNLCRTDRYVLFKVGPVIAANHGMGMPSLSILLHELAKLLHYAKAEDPVFIRLGTSGGIGIPPGSVVVTDSAFDGSLRCQHEDIVLGKVRRTPAVLNKELAQEIVSLCGDVDYQVVIGSTMATSDFYEGQGRLDGALCEYTEADKMEYLERLKKLGIKNIEMEATQLAAFCHRANIRAAVVCVTLLNRLNGDQVDIPPKVYADYQKRPMETVYQYIKKHVEKKKDDDVDEPTKKKAK